MCVYIHVRVCIFEGINDELVALEIFGAGPRVKTPTCTTLAEAFLNPECGVVALKAPLLEYMYWSEWLPC